MRKPREEKPNCCPIVVHFCSSLVHVYFCCITSSMIMDKDIRKQLDETKCFCFFFACYRFSSSSCNSLYRFVFSVSVRLSKVSQGGWVKQNKENKISLFVIHICTYTWLFTDWFVKERWFELLYSVVERWDWKSQVYFLFFLSRLIDCFLFLS